MMAIIARCHVAVALVFGIVSTTSVHAANNIDLVLGNSASGINNATPFASTDDSAVLGVDLVNSGWSTTGQISISTTESGLNTELGNLILSAGLNFNNPANPNKSLYLNAHNNIILNAAFFDSVAGNDYLNLYLTPNSDSVGGGSVYLNSIQGGSLNTLVFGDLVIGSSGGYNLDQANAALTANSINNSGAMTQTAATSAANVTGMLSIAGAGSYVLTNGALAAGAIDNSGAFTQGGGTNTVSGVLTNNAGGSYNLNGGTLNAASIVNSGVMTQAGATSATNVTGALSIAGGAAYALNKGALATGSIDNSGAIIQVAGTNTVGGALTLNAGGSYDLKGGSLQAGSLDVRGAMTQTEGFIPGYSWIYGDLTINVAGTTTTSAANVTGTLSVADGGSYTQSGGSNTVGGALTLNTGGSYVLSGGSLVADSIVRSGGTFTWSNGNLKLNNDSLAVNNTGLVGGALTIATGKNLSTVNQDIGTGFVSSGMVSQSGGSNTATGALTLNAGGSYALNGGSLYAGSLNVSGAMTQTGQTPGYYCNPQNSSCTSAVVGGALTVNAGGSYELNGGFLRAASVANNGGFNFTSGSLSLGTGLTVGSSGLLGSSVSLDNSKYLVLDGQLSIDAGSAVTLNGGYLSAGSAVNNGSFSFTAGGLSLSSGLTVGSSGLLGSSVSLGSSKNLYLGGQLSIDAGSAVTLNGGSLYASSVANNGSFTFNSGSLALDSMAIGNTGLFNSLALTSNRRLFGGAVTVGAGGTLGVASGYQYLNSLTNSATVTVSGGSLDAGSMSNSGTVTVSGGSLVASSVSNSGTIAVTAGSVTSNNFTNSGATSIAAGAALNIVPVANNNVGAYTQTAGTTTVNGVLQGKVVLQGGVVNGSGQIDGDLEFSGGYINPGNSPGSFDVNGNFTMTGGVLNLEVAKDGNGGYLWDKLFVSGNYDLSGGSVSFSLLGDLNINTFTKDFSFGDFFRVGNQASNSGLDISMLAGLSFGAHDAANQYYNFELTPTGAFVASAVPVPAAVWLFGSGLLGLLGVAKRKSKAA